MINPISSGSMTYTNIKNEKRYDSRNNPNNQEQTSDRVEIDSHKNKPDFVTYTKSAAKKPSAEEIEKLWEESEKATQVLRDLVEKLIMNQEKKARNSGNFVTIDSETRAEAQRAVSEDGEWGVKAVSSRIVAFAKAICGGDKSKIGEIKNAIEKGFSEAERMLGGSLPEISHRTHDEIMRELDEWAKE